MTLGTKIQHLRGKKNMSQKELANLLGVSTGTVAEWESGEAEPNLTILANLCKELSVSTDELLEITIEEPALEVQHSSVASATHIIKKHSPKAKSTIAMVFCIVAVALIITLIIGGLFTLNVPEERVAFSEDTVAIENADASVVTLFCYDVFGELSATGSGFLAFDGKTVITNYHVIEDAYICKISTNQDISFNVEKLVCYSEDYDIAILQLEKDTGLIPLTFGNANNIKKGEPVVAIGSPLGIKNTVSTGILSGRIMRESMDILQFTAPISSGSSGGALFDDNGNVIGITYASYESGQNLNLAIPIELAIELYKEADPCDFSKVYIEKNPYVPTLLKYKDSPIVSVSDLKKNPQKYDEQYVLLYAYVSSQGIHTVGPLEQERWYFSEGQNVSFDFEYDDWAEYPPNGISYRDSAVICTSMSNTLCEYVDRSISEGDYVMVAAYFDFLKEGEVLAPGNPDSMIQAYDVGFLYGVIIIPAE